MLTYELTIYIKKTQNSHERNKTANKIHVICNNVLQ